MFGAHHVFGNVVFVFDDEYHVKARQNRGHEVNVLKERGGGREREGGREKTER